MLDFFFNGSELFFNSVGLVAFSISGTGSIILDLWPTGTYDVLAGGEELLGILTSDCTGLTVVQQLELVQKYFYILLHKCVYSPGIVAKIHNWVFLDNLNKFSQ